LLCPLLCGLFFFWKGAKGELSYKVKKAHILLICALVSEPKMTIMNTNFLQQTSL